MQAKTETSVLKQTAVVSAIALAASVAHASDWDLDPVHTTAAFSVRHMMVTNVRGEFDKVSGSVSLDDEHPEKSSVQVTIDVNSINTRNEQRDNHLKSADFFDAANHPQLTFESTKVQKAGAGHFKVTGNLTMRGVTKSVVLDVEGPTAAIKNPWGKTVRGVSVSGKLNRKDWGLNWNTALETGGVVVGEEVKLQIDAELIQREGALALK